MEGRIVKALEHMFEKHRIVFWYDGESNLSETFESLQIDGVRKLSIEDNEFFLKYHMLREFPTEKFLIYKNGPRPEDLNNWLLDIELSHGEFSAKQETLWRIDMEWDIRYDTLILEHINFFQSDKRRNELKALINGNDSFPTIRLKMLAVCVSSDCTLESIILMLFEDYSNKTEEKMKCIERCNLDKALWGLLKDRFDYKSNNPSIKDFLITIFNDSFIAMKKDYLDYYSLGGKLNAEASIFVNQWKDSRRHEKSFEILSDECAELLEIEATLNHFTFEDLKNSSIFRLTDKKIINDISKGLLNQTIRSDEISAVLTQRKSTYFYRSFINEYEALDSANQFFSLLLHLDLTFNSFSDGLKKYKEQWFKIDQSYRKFVFHWKKTSQSTLLGPLAEKIENYYTNNFLLPLNDHLQSFINELLQWKADGIKLQNEFYVYFVQPFLKNNGKLVVIVSDALRFEIAEEMLRIVRMEDRFEASLEAMLSMLPSYTQLGMGALLPPGELCITEGDKGTVLHNKLNTAGIENRRKILQNKSVAYTAIKSEELMLMKSDECKVFIRDHDLIYIYHNNIDAVGDKKASEENVFNIVEQELEGLLKMIKKLTNVNVNNILLTADHGFLYQDRAINESDFLGDQPEGDAILYRDRRFVIGKGLLEKPGLRKFTSESLGLCGGVEIQIPKSINRLRLSGSGSRFVHGGSSFQEIMVPVLKINKKRRSDVTFVDVDVLISSHRIISTTQIALRFYQNSAITEKNQPITLRAGFYSESNVLLSNVFEHNFDISSENPRDREKPVVFNLSKRADEFNGQEIILRIEERINGTNTYREYKLHKFLLKKSFTNDFDF